MNKQDLQRSTASTLVAKVEQVLRAHIAGRKIAPGARLPSIRGLSRTLGISPSTVVEAYDRLAADAVIRSRPGSGFYVAGRLPPFTLADTELRLDREVDPLWMSRQSLEADEGFLKPGCGWLPSDWMPQADIRKSLRQLARGPKSGLTDYGSPMGFAPLRQQLSRRLLEQGVEAAPSQIMLTESGTQSVDLLCRFLLEPGDAVLVDDPCYFNFHALLRAHRAHVVSVPYTPAGPDLEKLARVLKDQAPRLYITNSALQNPTGASLTPAVAHRVLKLAEQYNFLIIEDDVFADFEEIAAPRLSGFDGLDRVIAVGSFSKTLSAAIRCGFIAAKSEWIEKLIDLKLATSFGGPALSAELIEGLLRSGAYRKHMNSVRARLADKRGEVGVTLEKYGLRQWVEPTGGMFLWCSLPEALDAAHVARYALADGVVLAPGNVFSPGNTCVNFLRFNVAQSSDPLVFSVLESAMQRAAIK